MRPSSPEIAYDVALAYFKAGVPRPTIAVFQAAPKGVAFSSAADRLIGDAFVETGDYARGIHYLGVSLRDWRQLGPRDCAALGTAQCIAGKNSEAEHSFLVAARLSGKAGSPYVARGDFYLGRGKTGEACAAYKTALAKDRDSSDAYEKYGNALAREDDLKKALTAYQRSLKLDPQRIDASVGMGKVLLKLDQPGKARDAFEEAIRLDPQAREASYQLAQALLRLGDKEQAKHMFARWYELNPGSQFLRPLSHRLGNKRGLKYIDEAP